MQQQAQASSRSELPQISSAVREDPITQSKEAKMPHHEQGANEHEVSTPSIQILAATPPSYICILPQYLQLPFISMQAGKMMFGQRPTCLSPRCEEGSEYTSMENE